MTSLTASRHAARRSATLASVRGVIFDLDGTLLDSEPLYRQAFGDALAELDHTPDHALYNRLIGLATPDRLERLTARYGPGFPRAAFQRAYVRHKQRCLRQAVPLKSGATALLAWLAGQRIPAAIATACSSSTAQHHLRRPELRDRFAAVMTRDHVRHRKPHPEVFLCAAQALRLRPEDCLVLEDSASGIEAANAAGAIPILIPDLAEVPDNIRRKSFAELPDLHAVRALLAGD